MRRDARPAPSGNDERFTQARGGGDLDAPTEVVDRHVDYYSHRTSPRGRAGAAATGCADARYAAAQCARAPLFPSIARWFAREVDDAAALARAPASRRGRRRGIHDKASAQASASTPAPATDART